MTDTDVAFLLYSRSCSCDRHDLYLPSIPISDFLTLVSRLETSVKKSEIDAITSTKLTAEDKMSNIMSNIMDEKLASLEARMMENIGRLLQAVNDNILKEQQVRHPSFPTCTERERQCSCKIRASAFQLTSFELFALCTLCLSLCLLCHILVLFLGLPWHLPSLSNLHPALLP
jgi:hypothetical protein